MARMSHKERIWERFAEVLAQNIAQKFFNEQSTPLKKALEDSSYEIFRKYIKPHIKAMEKLPEGFLRKDNSFTITDGKGRLTCKLDGEQLAPYGVTITKEEFETHHKLYQSYHALPQKQHDLRYDLFNNIVMAENFAEVVEKWPEAKELAEEVALTYAQSMNQPLSKILGKYTPDKMLPAPKK